MRADLDRLQYVQRARTGLAKRTGNCHIENGWGVKVLGLEKSVSEGNLLEKFERLSWVEWIRLVLSCFTEKTWDQFLDSVMRLILEEFLIPWTFKVGIGCLGKCVYCPWGSQWYVGQPDRVLSISSRIGHIAVLENDM